MQFDEALRYLLGLGHETLALKLGLANTEALLAALGYPERSYARLQIAGTNGKGSVAAMVERAARAAGLRTGLYTSPHLISITERVRVRGADISREDFARSVTTVRDASLEVSRATGALPTFFEQVTAAALLHFREAGVELAILETGLGGRLDATTAARSAFAALTPVDYDHQEYLGHTLAEIAAEKAAVVRPGVTVAACVAWQTPEAEEVILRRCLEADVVARRPATVVRADEECGDTNSKACGRLRVTFETARASYENVCLALRGRHQVENAALAVAVAEMLAENNFPLARRHVVEGLERAEHPGRLELIEGDPPVLLDGAHNPAGARALRAYLGEFARAPVTLVFGAMRDKALAEIAATLFPAASRLVLTRPDNARAAAPGELRDSLPAALDSGKITLAADAGQALRFARDVTPPGGLVCVTGSLYLVGEARKKVMSDE